MNDNGGCGSGDRKGGCSSGGNRNSGRGIADRNSGCGIGGDRNSGCDNNYKTDLTSLKSLMIL